LEGGRNTKGKHMNSSAHVYSFFGCKK